jgi:hypothetical protein
MHFSGDAGEPKAGMSKWDPVVQTALVCVFRLVWPRNNIPRQHSENGQRRTMNPMQRLPVRPGEPSAQQAAGSSKASPASPIFGSIVAAEFG